MVSKNKEKLRAQSRSSSSTYYYRHKNRALAAAKKWREENLDKMKAAKARWNEANKTRITKTFKIWTKKNKEKRKVYQNEKYKNDLQFRLKKVIASSINTRLKRKRISKNIPKCFSKLSFTVEDLIKHLEQQFTKGMSWDNYGKWHIDHIVPDSSFNYSSVDDKEFQECWALKNLQPLWAHDNQVKNNRK